MQEQVPNFDKDTIAKIIVELFGIDGGISSLVSFEDQNFLITTTTTKTRSRTEGDFLTRKKTKYKVFYKII